MPTSGKEHKDLIEGIKQDNAFFQQMVDLIPKDLTATKSVEDKDGEPMKKKKKKKKESQMTDGETKTDDVTKKKKKKKLKMKDPDIRQIRSESGTSSVDVLRQKLHTQLEELKGTRKLSADQLLERKKLRKKNKQKVKNKSKPEKQVHPPGLTPVKGQSSDVSPAQKSTKPIYNKEGRMVFSKFDFSESGEKVKSQSGLTGKDYKRLLEKIEKKKEKDEKLKLTNEEMSERREEKTHWDNAIYRAQGEKVHDDPERLKKAIRVKEKMKEKRKKKWVDRTEIVEKHMEARQHKRTKNIQSRKDAKIQKKIKKAKKKGRIPGF